MNNRYDSFYIGQKAELVHKITKKDISDFTQLSGDDNKLHIDEEFAANTSFETPIAHGMLGASFISTIIGTKIPGDGALWFSQSLDFLLPVRAGDEIKVCAEIVNKYDKENIIELKTDIFNQFGQKVTSGYAKVKVIQQKQKTQLQQIEQEKIALVLGGTGGIGRAVVKTLASNGWDVLIHCNSNVGYAKQLQSEIIELKQKCYVIQADLLNEDEILKIKENIERHFSKLTAIINCTTIKVPNIKFYNMKWQEMQKHFDINIKSNFYLVQSLSDFFTANKYGKIIFLNTQYTDDVPPNELLHYVTAKSALSGFAKSLAVELAPKGIRVNVVSPGMTQTELIADLPERTKLLTEAKTPLKRLANTQDVANAIFFLASDKSDYLTGETIRVNGGQSMI